MTEKQRSGSVLIVGAGPAGMAAALELRKWGVKATIIDALKTPRATSRAGGVQPRTYELLDRYGISERIIAGRKGINGFTSYRNGKAVSRMETTLANSRYRQPAGAPQAIIEKIFRETLAEQDVHVLWQHKLLDIRQDESSATARIETPEGILTFTADWIIGCDGANSKVREQLGIAFEGSSYPEAYGLMDADLDWDLPPDTLRTFRDDGPQQIVVVPFDSEFYRIQIDHRPLELADVPPTVEEMQAVFDRVVGLPGKISNPRWSSGYRVHRKQAVTYRSGRVFIAGDAAHIHSPAGAQGLNTGVQDGINLGWKLGLVLEEAAAPALLDSYEAERLPIAQAVLRLSDMLLRNPDALLANPGIPPQVLADTAAQLLVNYRPGPLGRAVDGPPGAPLPPGTPPGAGDRLPDVEIGGNSIYCRLRDARLVVALFGDEAATAKAASEFARFGAAVDVWRHREGDELASALGLSTGAAIIRPDAYLGAVVKEDVSRAAGEVASWLQSRVQLIAR